MKLLACVTTCDRSLLLRNAVESFFDFFPFGDVLVVDDASERMADTGLLAAVLAWVPYPFALTAPPPITRAWRA